MNQVDWVKRIKERQKKAKEAEEEAEKEGYSTQKPGTSPSNELTDYPGSYEHPGYGLIKIELQNEKYSSRSTISQDP